MLYEVITPEILAPGLTRIGAMLPPTPLHQLLLDGLARPLVVTSGNLAGEPPCLDEAGAFIV